MLTEEDLVPIVLLMPGFLAAKVFSALAVRKKQTAIEMIVEVVLFEFLVLTTYAVLSHASPIFRIVTTHLGDSAKQTESLEVDLRANDIALVAIALYALLWGIVLAVLHNGDFLTAPLRWMRLTKQSSHSTVWEGVFHDYANWVVVTLDSGTRILGWPSRYSDTPGEGSIFLTHASYLGAGKETVAISDPGILITKAAKIVSVHFVPPKNS